MTFEEVKKNEQVLGCSPLPQIPFTQNKRIQVYTLENPHRLGVTITITSQKILA